MVAHDTLPDVSRRACHGQPDRHERNFVARGVIEALFNGEAGSTYALAAGEAATNAGAIGDIAARVFDVSPPRFVSGP
jgi:hypothetical protein